MRIKLHSPYNHFPNHLPNEGELYINCYNDAYVTHDVEPNSIALLIEPRSIQPKVYAYMDEHWDKFKYVFTHDSELLKKPNAKLILWGGVYDWSDMEKDFEHPISMVASHKELSPVRIQRKNLALEFKAKNDPKICTYGTFDGGEYADTKTIYGQHPFSVVIENYIDDYWFTEKICNCFSNLCVPIYYGARKITDYFIADGIIQCNSIEEIKIAVNYIKIHARDEYYLRASAIQRNNIRVNRYKNFETWFFGNYGELLDELGVKYGLFYHEGKKK